MFNIAPQQGTGSACSRASISMRGLKFRRERLLLLVLIVALSLGAWAYSATDAARGEMSTSMSSAGPDMNTVMLRGVFSRIGNATERPEAPFFGMFVPMWTVMCIAMMLPTTWPMAFAYAAITRKRRERGVAFAPTWAFLLGYLIVWGVFGVVCWTAAVGIFALIGGWIIIRWHLMLGTGLLFLATGIYQLSPIKDVCLGSCRHPLLFVIHNWRDGYVGATVMGMHHGILCVGCCWAMMVVLFPLGMMNLLWMGAFTLIMYLEKNFRHGVLVGRITGAAMALAGVILVLSAGVFLGTGKIL